MKPHYIQDELLETFIRTALQEDVGPGDYSALASIPENSESKAALLVKGDGIIAGVELANQIFSYFDPTLTVSIMLEDGAPVKKGDKAFFVEGKSRSILTTERLVLNCMQRMSGIATKTARLVKLISPFNVQLTDTRKTTPNFRAFEKWAVLLGGGKNHRMGLYDMVMLKDNHIDTAGGIEQAIIQTKDYLRANQLPLKIEVETRTLAEVRQALKIGGIDIIMLDNMSLEDMRKAVTLIDGRCKVEASGGITESTIEAIAACGVDYISMGELTHSVTSLDLSLKVVK